jgi:plasmid stabilization system protein ParE
MVQIKWTDQAVLDLKAIALYISRDSKNMRKFKFKKSKKGPKFSRDTLILAK